MKSLQTTELIQVTGGQLNGPERFQHDCFLASVVAYPAAVALTYFTSGARDTTISAFVTHFGIFEAIGITIGAGASIYFRNPERVD